MCDNLYSDRAIQLSHVDCTSVCGVWSKSMKRCGIITNASKNAYDETVVAYIEAFTGTMFYMLGKASFKIDFDECLITMSHTPSKLFTWEPVEEDLDFHKLDFGIYISGELE